MKFNQRLSSHEWNIFSRVAFYTHVNLIYERFGHWYVMQIDKFLMKVHVIFGALKGNHSQYRGLDVTDESVVSNVRVNVQLVTMGVKIYAVAKTCSVVVDIIFNIIWIDPQRFSQSGGK